MQLKQKGTKLLYNSGENTIALVNKAELKTYNLRRVGTGFHVIQKQRHFFTYVNQLQRRALRANRKGKGVCSGVYSLNTEGKLMEVLAYPFWNKKKEREAAMAKQAELNQQRRREAKKKMMNEFKEHMSHDVAKDLVEYISNTSSIGELAGVGETFLADYKKQKAELMKEYNQWLKEKEKMMKKQVEYSVMSDTINDVIEQAKKLINEGILTKRPNAIRDELKEFDKVVEDAVEFSEYAERAAEKISYRRIPGPTHLELIIAEMEAATEARRSSNRRSSNRRSLTETIYN